jgi:hypothetical protein
MPGVTGVECSQPHERTVNGCAAGSGEEKFDLSERIARFCDILNRERPIIEIGPRSIFVNPEVGGWR